MSNDKERPNYYGILPANVRYNSSISPNAKILYTELTALTVKDGYCYASNKYFANLYNVTPKAISKWINQLERNNYITLEYIYEGKQCKERRIRIAEGTQVKKKKVSTDVDRVSTTRLGGINDTFRGYQQTIKDNNTRINNTSNNNDDDTKQKQLSQDEQDTELYGVHHNVLLTKREYQNLLSKYSEEVIDNAIDTLSDWKKSKGYMPQIHTDYAQLLKWAISSVLVKKKPKMGSFINTQTDINEVTEEDLKQMNF